MRSLLIIGIVGCVIIACIAAFLLSSHFPPAEYWRLRARGRGYYTSVAKACDHLIAQGGTTPQQLRGTNLQSLPVILRDLGPERITVRTNVVQIDVGVGLTSHIIVWAPDEIDSSFWELKVYIGDSRRKSKILFKKMNGDQ